MYVARESRRDVMRCISSLAWYKALFVCLDKAKKLLKEQANPISFLNIITRLARKVRYCRRKMFSLFFEKVLGQDNIREDGGQSIAYIW